MFKINIGFGSILYDTVNNIYRYYYVSTNHYLFDTGFTISTNSDMADSFRKNISLDLADKIYFLRPSSEWILAGLPIIEIRIMRLKGVPIGSGVQLPVHIKNSKSVISSTHDYAHGHGFDDSLCFFQCLALHFEASINGLEGPGNRLKERL